MSGWALVLDQACFNDGLGLKVVGGGLLAAMVACAVAGVFIHYWNRPKFLVPPHLRNDPGLFAERRLPDFNDYDDVP